MISLIEEKLPLIQKLCQRHRIAKLWLFGSAVDEAKFGPNSDIDFLFNFDDGGKFLKDFRYVDAFLNMKEDLQKLL